MKFEVIKALPIAESSNGLEREHLNHGSITKPRIAYLIAGAGGMYCGSCMRDNRIAATLLELGFDVQPIPLYTPIRTDESDVCVAPILYGGIGLYLSHKSRFFRALPNFVNRILDSPALLRLASGVAVKTDSRDVGDLTVATLQPESALHHRYFAALLRTLRRIEPDLIHLPNLMFVGLAGRLKNALGVPVVCTLAGEDVFLDQLSPPFNAQACDLIRQGAILTETAEDILEIISPDRQINLNISTPTLTPAAPPSQLIAPLDNQETDDARKLVERFVGPTPTHVDTIIRECGVTSPTLSAALLELELAGRLERHPGNLISLSGAA